ncbi:MAG: glutathione S-transferase family protein [Pseudomonadota bacterium]
MTELTIFTLNYVPEMPRGFVRDIRLRWACEEANLPYRVEGLPFEAKSEQHFLTHPFGQVPWLTDGDITIFESGAGLLYLAQKSEKLMPREPAEAAEALQWTMSALNSVEMVSVPWWFLEVTGAKQNGLTGWFESRLAQMEKVLKAREFLAANRFTVADLAMVDVLRIAKVRAFGNRPATEAYIKRITERPAFKKAHADQMAHFANAD